MKVEKILISDKLDAKCAEILENNGFQVTQKTDHTPEELLQVVKDYDALIVRSATKVSDEVIRSGAQGRLRLVGRAGVGIDNIDLAAATSHKVLVMNTPAANTLSAAEHTCALIMSLARRIPAAVMSVKSGAWDRAGFVGSELMGKTLGIVGLGRIGREVGVRMRAFGMRTVGYDPLVGAEESAKFDVDWMDLDTLWPQCDYITIHVPLLPETKNLISSSVLSACKRGVKVLNVSRGGIIDEEALLLAVQDGRCGGAALDVYSQEPPGGSPPLRDLIAHPLIIPTPHLGASTVEAQQRVGQEVARQVVQLVREGQRMGLINPQVLDKAE